MIESKFVGIYTAPVYSDNESGYGTMKLGLSAYSRLNYYDDLFLMAIL